MKHACRIVTVFVLGAGIVTAVAAYHHFDGHDWRFQGMHGWHDTPVERQARMVERVSGALQLDAVQQSRLERLLDELWRVRNDLRGDQGTLRANLVTLLSPPSLDRQQALVLVTDALQRVEQRAPATIDALAGFTDSLSPVQKATLLDWLQRHDRERFGY